jgi:hypothetical protein
VDDLFVYDPVSDRARYAANRFRDELAEAWAGGWVLLKSAAFQRMLADRAEAEIVRQVRGAGALELNDVRDASAEYLRPCAFEHGVALAAVDGRDGFLGIVDLAAKPIARDSVDLGGAQCFDNLLSVEHQIAAVQRVFVECHLRLIHGRLRGITDDRLDSSVLFAATASCQGQHTRNREARQKYAVVHGLGIYGRAVSTSPAEWLVSPWLGVGVCRGGDARPAYRRRRSPRRRLAVRACPVHGAGGPLLAPALHGPMVVRPQRSNELYVLSADNKRPGAAVTAPALAQEA